MANARLVLLAAVAVVGAAIALIVVAFVLVTRGGGSEERHYSIAAGPETACLVTDGGGVLCWGNGTDGQLGNGVCCDERTDKGQPVPGFGPGEDQMHAVEVSAGRAHVCALLDDGNVMCWGGNWAGEIGNGSGHGESSPVRVRRIDGEAAALSAALGRPRTCVVTTSRGVLCWGDNQFGEIGDGTKETARPKPVEVVGLDGDVDALSAGAEHTCVLMTSSEVRCWGHNQFGQLGDGTRFDSDEPVVVLDGSGNHLSGVSAVAAGLFHTCAALERGGVVCWGANVAASMDDLNNGIAGYDETPVAVPGLESKVVAVEAGGFHTCALTAAAAVECWGNDEMGQLGDGEIGDSYVSKPTHVDGLDGVVVAIGAGDAQTCALLESDEVFCWGNSSWVPKPVPMPPLSDGSAQH